MLHLPQRPNTVPGKISSINDGLTDDDDAKLEMRTGTPSLSVLLTTYTQQLAHSQYSTTIY